ncbi:MAG: aspartate carbamoyltransferase regulatory subunit [Peptococcaceae bacterium]|jgi:aspartate carbamoyltransferase regulatory subunit|nr:aspartate carbamoyltransferase regulatory subunit [Peptococcaceae bacterium]
MLNIDSLERGIVIDHIRAGSAMGLYQLLNLDRMQCCVAIIKNVRSNKYGKKDIIKVEDMLDLDLDILGYIDPNITIAIIDDGKIIEKKRLVPPKILKNVIRCKNPRCITSIEEDADHIFRLSEGQDGQRYRCIYCEQEDSGASDWMLK